MDAMWQVNQTTALAQKAPPQFGTGPSRELYFDIIYIIILVYLFPIIRAASLLLPLVMLHPGGLEFLHHVKDGEPVVRIQGETTIHDVGHATFYQAAVPEGWIELG